MLISQATPGESRGRQGSQPANLAELRSLLARPSGLTDGHRQRLSELGRAITRVRGLGAEYSRVDFSSYAQAVAGSAVGVV